MAVNTFWWRGVPNFGDVLARDLVQRLTGRSVRWTPVEQADLVVVGSIASMLPPGWTGTVLGIGTARPEPVDLSRARVLALRGHLTAHASELPMGTTPALGDPGLLADVILDRVPSPRHAVGVVAHWQDRELRRQWPSGLHIDVRREPEYVIRQIAQCERIVSSSLHGIIVADALGIERRWETFAKVQGGGHKFRDHASVVGPFEPGEWGAADPDAVRHAKLGLLRAFSRL